MCVPSLKKYLLRRVGNSILLMLGWRVKYLALNALRSVDSSKLEEWEETPFIFHDSRDLITFSGGESGATNTDSGESSKGNISSAKK